MDETALIRRALDAAGYIDEPSTPEALRECLYDYIDAGVFRNLDCKEEAEDFTVAEMAWGLIRYCR